MNPSRVLFVGRTTLDLLYRLDHLPAEDTKVYARDFQAAPGGPALNAAITHSLLGGESLLISAVGGGPWSIPVRAELERHCIALLDLAAETAYETPLCTVLINAASSTRTIINPPLSTVQLPPLAVTTIGHPTLTTPGCPTLAASLFLRLGWDTSQSRTTLDQHESERSGIPQPSTDPNPISVPHVLLTDGFHLEQTLPFLADCHAAGVALCLDGGSWKPGTSELAPMLTVAICSERFVVPGTAGDPDSLFAWFAAQGVPHVALTRGPRPILCSDHGRRFQIEIAPINAADTLGAGDVLHGAFVHHFASGHDFESALRKAAQTATLSCQSLGVQAWATATPPQNLPSATNPLTREPAISAKRKRTR
jgi:sugar/nucleoside kinase (ribokinase family)